MADFGITAPAVHWKVTELKIRTKARLMAEINEIVSGLSEWTDDLDKPLTELFILGYRCQLEKLQKDMKAAAEAKAQKEREKRAAEQQDSEE